jgi:hypothetical protein
MGRINVEGKGSPNRHTTPAPAFDPNSYTVEHVINIEIASRDNSKVQ